MGSVFFAEADRISLLSDLAWFSWVPGFLTVEIPFQISLISQWGPLFCMHGLDMSDSNQEKLRYSWCRGLWYSMAQLYSGFWWFSMRRSLFSLVSPFGCSSNSLYNGFEWVFAGHFLLAIVSYRFPFVCSWRFCVSIWLFILSLGFLSWHSEATEDYWCF